MNDKFADEKQKTGIRKARYVFLCDVLVQLLVALNFLKELIKLTSCDPEAKRQIEKSLEF